MKLKKQFIEAAKDVWGGKLDLSRTHLTTHETEMKPYARLKVKGKHGKALKDLLIKPPYIAELHVNPKFKKLSKEKQTRALKHEAGHLGYPHHGKDFINLMEKTGGAMSENSLEKTVFYLQGKPAKKGGRYKTIKGFETQTELNNFVKDFTKKNKGMRLRVKI